MNALRTLGWAVAGVGLLAVLLVAWFAAMLVFTWVVSGAAFAP